MANKVMSLHDAVEKYVCDNDVLCLGGFTTNRKPYAAVYEILRQGKTGFVGWSGPAGGDWDALIGEGRVRAYINCYTANSGYTNVARRFRAAIEKGELTYEDYSGRSDASASCCISGSSVPAGTYDAGLRTC